MKLTPNYSRVATEPSILDKGLFNLVGMGPPPPLPESGDLLPRGTMIMIPQNLKGRIDRGIYMVVPEPSMKMYQLESHHLVDGERQDFFYYTQPEELHTEIREEEVKIIGVLPWEDSWDDQFGEV